MAILNSELRYGTIAMLFHWLIALLLIANIVLGLIAADMERGDPARFITFQTHKSIGLTVLVLSILRLAWRLFNQRPGLPIDMHRGMRFAAHATHWLFYFLIVAIPLTGWIMVSASSLGNPTAYFGLFDWPNISYFADMTREQKRPIHETFEDIHSFLAWSAIVLIPIHVAAGLYHQFLRRDDVLRRMLPRRRSVA